MPVLTHSLIDVDEAMLSHVVVEMKWSAKILNALHTVEHHRAPPTEGMISMHVSLVPQQICPSSRHLPSVNDPLKDCAW